MFFGALSILAARQPLERQIYDIPETGFRFQNRYCFILAKIQYLMWVMADKIRDVKAFRHKSGVMGKSNSLLLALLLLLAGAAPAAEIESLDSIRDTVRQFLEQESDSLGEDVEVSVGHLDTRLRLPRCGSALQAAWPVSARRRGNVTVSVSCSAPSNWSLYVQATVQVFENVVVSGRSMSRGELLGKQDVELTRRDVSALSSGYFTRTDEVAGMVLKRSVRAGMVMTPSLLKQQRLIRRGDKVTIIAVSGGVEVRMEGQALMDGVKGEVIRVRNLSSKLEVEAEVISPGLVRVRM